jgi:hypothetical protein
MGSALLDMFGVVVDAQGNRQCCGALPKHRT